MADEQLEEVQAGVQKLEGQIEVFVQQKDVEKLAKLAHGLAKVALRALEDAKEARRDDAQIIEALKEREGAE